MSFQKCPICEGTGVYNSIGSKCPTCDGKRIISEINGLPPEEVAEIKVPSMFDPVEPCEINDWLCKFPLKPLTEEYLNNYKKSINDYKEIREKLKNELEIPGAGPN